MDNNEISTIERQIGNYSFRNKMLLVQAFTRRTYSHENPEVADNEELEFYGDKALAFYLAYWFEESFNKNKTQSQNYGLLIPQNEYYFSEKNEGELTKLFSYYADKSMLSTCIENLDLAKYLRLGKADINNKAWESESVQEDLFEAIVGAVAIDSNWNNENIFQVCRTMLCAGNYSENYIRLLEDYSSDENFKVNYNTAKFWNGPFQCTVILTKGNSISYTAKGNSEFEAKMEAAKIGCHAFEKMYMKECVGEPDFDRAVSQVHELYQHDWIDEPVYDDTEEEFDDETGEHFWICKLDLDSFDHYFVGKQTTKKEAKKEAAYNALKEILA